MIALLEFSTPMLAQTVPLFAAKRVALQQQQDCGA